MEWQTRAEGPCILSGPHFRTSFPKVVLEIVRGQARELVRPVAGPVFLMGTGTDCDLVLGDPQFPEVYAYLFVTQQGVSLRHLGAGPILIVNGRVLEVTSLLDGDVLRTGRYEFQIHINWDSSPEPSPNRRSKTSASEFDLEEGREQLKDLLCEVRGFLADIHRSPFTPVSSRSISNKAPIYRATG